MHKLMKQSPMQAPQNTVDDTTEKAVVTVEICGEKFAFLSNSTGMPNFNMEVYKDGKLTVSRSYYTKLHHDRMVLYEVEVGE